MQKIGIQAFIVYYCVKVYVTWKVYLSYAS